MRNGVRKSRFASEDARSSHSNRELLHKSVDAELGQGAFTQINNALQSDNIKNALKIIENGIQQ